MRTYELGPHKNDRIVSQSHCNRGRSPVARVPLYYYTNYCVNCPATMLFTAILLIVTARSLESATVAKEKASNMDIIRFPVEEEVTRFDSKPAKLQASLDNRFGDDGVHESCKNQTFCTIKPPNYPQEKFDELFKDYKIPPMPVADVIGNRQGDPSYDNGCESIPTFEPLYKVRVKRDEDAWRTVVQAPSREYLQRIRLETCMTTSSCFRPLLETNPEFETACVQVYTAWEVLLETEDGKGTERLNVELPTCCSCQYKKIRFESRFADVAANKTKA